MEILFSAFNAIMQGFKTPMTIYGFTFSFWDIMVFSALVSILGYFIGKVIYG